MFSVEVHPEVYAELENSRAWYADRAENLGAGFLDEVNRAIETLRAAPAMWPLYDKRQAIRRYLVHRFPYGIIYRTEDRATIFAEVRSENAAGRRAGGGWGRLGDLSERRQLAQMHEKTGGQYDQDFQTPIQQRFTYEVSVSRIWMAVRCTGSTASAGMSS